MISHRQHLLIAGIIWLMVAIMLMARGIYWVVTNVHVPYSIITGFLLVIAAGFLKGRFVLSRAAVRNIGHIRRLDARSPFWKVYTLPMYLLVVSMVGIGIFCRWVGAHWHVFWIIGYIYSAIGVALITGSASFWMACFTNS